MPLVTPAVGKSVQRETLRGATSHAIACAYMQSRFLIVDAEFILSLLNTRLGPSRPRSCQLRNTAAPSAASA